METIEEIAQRPSVDIYQAALKHFETAEHAGLIYGNGHHAAQRIAEYVKGDFLSRRR